MIVSTMQDDFQLTVTAMLEACRRGPPAGRVEDVAIEEYRGPPLTRFTVLPTA